MIRVVVACVCAALLGGCTSGHVGMRGGAVATLGGGQETGPVTSSASHIGGVYGMSFGGRFSDKVGLQTDITVRHAGLTQDVRAIFAQGGTTYQFDGTIEGTAQIVEMPLLLVLGRRLEGPIQPFIGVGGSLGFRYSQKAVLAGTLTVLDGEGVGMRLPANESSSSSYFSDDPLIGFAALFGADYTLAPDWSLRGELRFNHDFMNDYLGAYQIGRNYSTSADVTSELPTTRLTLAVSLVFAL